MHRNKLACSVLVLAVATSMWACGSDDDSSGGTAGSGGAHAGSGGKATGGGGGAKAGAGGRPQGGGDNGGAGEAGAGEAGAGEVAGAGGDSVGGAGGAGESSEAGAGGEGGAAPALTLQESCTAVCAAKAGLACTLGDACVDDCVVTGSDPDFGTTEPVKYLTMVQCQAEVLSATNYQCSSGTDGPVTAIVKAGTVCEQKICAWACPDLSGLVDGDIFARCNCPQ